MSEISFLAARLPAWLASELDEVKRILGKRAQIKVRVFIERLHDAAESLAGSRAEEIYGPKGEQ